MVVAPVGVVVIVCETLAVDRVLGMALDGADDAPEEVGWSLCLDESVEVATVWSDAGADPDAVDGAGLEVNTPVAFGADVADPAWR